MIEVEYLFYQHHKNTEHNLVFQGYSKIMNLITPEERAALAKSLFESKDKDFISLRLTHPQFDSRQVDEINAACDEHFSNA